MDLTAVAIASLTTLVGAILASGAGTGGGALYMPTYTIIMGDVHRAVPLSKVTILGLSVTCFFVNLPRTHPTSKRPLINFEISTLLEPASLAGAIIGILLNIVLPSWSIIICLVCVLSITFYKTLTKGVKQFKNEVERAKKIKVKGGQAIEAGDTHEEDAYVLWEEESVLSDTHRTHKDIELVNSSNASFWGSTTNPEESNPFSQFDPNSQHDNVTTDSPHSLHSLHLRCQQSRHFLTSDQLVSWKQVVLLCVVWGVSQCVLSVCGGPVALVCGQWWEVMGVGGVVFGHVCVSVGFGYYLKEYRRQRMLLGIHEASVEDGGLEWVDARAIYLYPFLAFLAGMAAGCLGIGGGLIKGPLLIGIGLSPLSAVTTASYMILFTASSNSLQYALLGRLELYPSIWFFAIACLGSVMGLLIISLTVKSLARQSYVTLLLAFTILLSLVSMLVSSLYNEVHGDTHNSLTLNTACQHLKQRMLTNEN
eukprot:GHVN01029727.1.p1 GENE.GHVN01029727.1~~GHVN01029727.1.p1  ORF type:complete len:480 (+),score=95.73 GHVN01029727.1:46-1485(+)